MAIQIRRGTNAQWESNNGNIVSGEPAIATDTKRFFVGTGTGTFAEFPTIEKVFDMIYPVGSIYMSTNSTSPATLFGGTWSQIEDTFLLASGSTYQAGEIGGEAEHTLSQGELPQTTGKITTWSSTPYFTGSIFESATGVFSGSAKKTGVIGRPTTENQSGTNSYGDIDMSFGNSEAHNNMPPYLAVYVWQRTA